MKRLSRKHLFYTAVSMERFKKTDFSLCPTKALTAWCSGLLQVCLFSSAADSPARMVFSTCACFLRPCNISSGLHNSPEEGSRGKPSPISTGEKSKPVTQEVSHLNKAIMPIKHCPG